MALIIKVFIGCLALLWIAGLTILFSTGPLESAMEPIYRLASSWTTVCIAGGSAIVALHQFYNSERWKRAEAARDMVDNLLANSSALSALYMAEQEQGEVFSHRGEGFEISESDVRQGLSDWTHHSAKCRLVRRNFQSLGFYLARLNLFLERGHVDEDRILPFFTIHAAPLVRLNPELSAYYERLGYRGAVKFIERLSSMRSESGAY